MLSRIKWRQQIGRWRPRARKFLLLQLKKKVTRSRGETSKKKREIKSTNSKGFLPIWRDVSIRICPLPSKKKTKSTALRTGSNCSFFSLFFHEKCFATACSCLSGYPHSKNSPTNFFIILLPVPLYRPLRYFLPVAAHHSPLASRQILPCRCRPFRLIFGSSRRLQRCQIFGARFFWCRVQVVRLVASWTCSSLFIPKPKRVSILISEYLVKYRVVLVFSFKIELVFAPNGI